MVTLPERKAPTDRWLTRSEVAALIRAARAHPQPAHIARFILIAVYTDTRKEVILSLHFDSHPGGGYIDADRGVFYRKAGEMRETAKRRPPVRMPQKLLRAARCWRKATGANDDWVVEYRGSRVASVKTAWRTICKTAGVPLADAAGFFGTSIQTLENVYLHHHPDFQTATAAALDGAKGRN